MPIPANPTQKGPTWSESEVAKLLSELENSEKVLLVCSAFPDGRPHPQYIGSTKPPEPRGCKNCWMAHYMYMWATSPPHLREAGLEAAERAIANTVQAYEQGSWDFVPNDHAVIEIETDAFDETTRVYKPGTN
jgi:hypothetical protein